MKTKTLFKRYTPAFASLLLAAVFLTGCLKAGKERIQNENFTIELLFEQNGCKMYRFSDLGEFIYWSDCQGKVQSNNDYTRPLPLRSTHLEAVTSE